MNAKESFESLGYTQILLSRKHDTDRIRYEKTLDQDEHGRTQKVIEFCFNTHRVTVWHEKKTFKGVTSWVRQNSSASLNLNEFTALQKQIHELLW